MSMGREFSATDRFETVYMSAQNIAHHRQVAARGAELRQRSARLLTRSKNARDRADAAQAKLDAFFDTRP